VGQGKSSSTERNSTHCQRGHAWAREGGRRIGTTGGEVGRGVWYTRDIFTQVAGSLGDLSSKVTVLSQFNWTGLVREEVQLARREGREGSDAVGRDALRGGAGGAVRMGRKQAEPSRDVRTVLDWSSRPALANYIAERGAGHLLPKGMTFNSRPEILQRMAARCALEELGDRLECQRDHTRTQQNYIELLERKTRWLEAKVCNTEEVVGVGDVEMVLDPDAVIRSVREALAGGVCQTLW
jgi:hypothetical protein